MATLQLVRVHEREAVDEILNMAYMMAHERTSDPEQWPHIFNQAVALLSARVPIMPQPSPIGLGGLGLPH